MFFISLCLGLSFTFAYLIFIRGIYFFSPTSCSFSYKVEEQLEVSFSFVLGELALDQIACTFKELGVYLLRGGELVLDQLSCTNLTNVGEFSRRP